MQGQKHSFLGLLIHEANGPPPHPTPPSMHFDIWSSGPWGGMRGCHKNIWLISCLLDFWSHSVNSVNGYLCEIHDAVDAHRTSQQCEADHGDGQQPDHGADYKDDHADDGGHGCYHGDHGDEPTDQGGFWSFMVMVMLIFEMVNNLVIFSSFFFRLSFWHIFLLLIFSSLFVTAWNSEPY